MTETMAADAHQSARAAQGAVPGHPHLRHRLARGRPGSARGTAAGRDRRDRRARPAGVRRATGTSRRPPARRSSRSTASGSCAPAISATRRGRLLLHRRSPEAHDQRGRLQGVAGGGRGDAVHASGPSRKRASSPPDARRGETVKAWSCCKPGGEGTVTEQQIIDWSRDHMAAYKVPRIVEFVTPCPSRARARSCGARCRRRRSHTPAGKP